MTPDELFLTATGFAPYGFQREICEAGLPEILNAQTGSGKTEAVVLGWIWRRYFHPDMTVRSKTPRWLVYALPMRTLVEQTVDRVQKALDRLHRSDADTSKVPKNIYNVMGGDRIDQQGNWTDMDWRLNPSSDAIFVGTIDMLLSRALNRGYGDGRFNWPISFGMFNNGTHWVFDETQLMGVAVPTSRQLQAFRDPGDFGTSLPTATTWMSATIDGQWLDTVDNRLDPALIRRIDSATEPESLQRRLRATKTIHEVALPESKRHEALASLLLRRHTDQSLTIAITNTVAEAVALAKALDKQQSKTETSIGVELLHSRFRPVDRRNRTAAALDLAKSAEGGIIVSTQVLEAGVDLSATLLYTDAAPWSSIVQRAGRCNRGGEIDGATILWSAAPTMAPYSEHDVLAAVNALRHLEGQSVDPLALSEVVVAVQPVDVPVLRRKDLVGLFDTAPDLSGNDLDVAKFIRVVDDQTIHIAWRRFDGQPPDDMDPLMAQELVAVPIFQARKFLAKHPAWLIDHLAVGSDDQRWIRVDRNDLHDGVQLLVESGVGGYSEVHGWDGRNKKPVAPVEGQGVRPNQFENDATNAGDIHSLSSIPVELARHLLDVERAVNDIADSLALDPSSPEIISAAWAGKLHDIGKAHKVFQSALRSANPDLGPGDWAKSGNRKRLRYQEPYFRHELVSMLALFGPADELLQSLPEPELIRYLVAAHHGRIRLELRSLPGEDPDVAWGVRHGEPFPEVKVADVIIPAHHVDLERARRGSLEHQSYSEQSHELLANYGPFQLALLEAIVRLADWQASSGAYATPNEEEMA